MINLRPKGFGKDFIVKQRRNITKLDIFDILVYKISNMQVEKNSIKDSPYTPYLDLRMIDICHICFIHFFSESIFKQVTDIF